MENPIPELTFYIALIGYNRPAILKRNLEILLDCDSIQKFHVRIFIDGPKDRDLDQAMPSLPIEGNRKESPISIESLLRSTNLGVWDNKLQSLSSCFESGADYVLLLEDDVELKRDALNFFISAARYSNKHQELNTISLYSTNFESSSPAAFEKALKFVHCNPEIQCAVGIRRWPFPWGIGLSKSSFHKFISLGWNGNDQKMGRILVEQNGFDIYPVLSRSIHCDSVNNFYSYSDIVEFKKIVDFSSSLKVPFRALEAAADYYGVELNPDDGAKKIPCTFYFDNENYQNKIFEDATKHLDLYPIKLSKEFSENEYFFREEFPKLKYPITLLSLDSYENYLCAKNILSRSIGVNIFIDKDPNWASKIQKIIISGDINDDFHPQFSEMLLKLSLQTESRQSLASNFDLKDQFTFLRAVTDKCSEVEQFYYFVQAIRLGLFANTIWIKYTLLKIGENYQQLLDKNIYLRSLLIETCFQLLSQENSDPKPFANFFLARMLMESEPIFSAKLFFSSYRSGYDQSKYYIADIAKNLDLDFQVSVHDPIFMNLFAKYIGEERELNYISVKNAKNCTLTSTNEAVEKKHPAPSGNTNFYAFENLSTGPQSEIYELKNGYFSFDISKLGLTSFYFFDADKNPIYEISHGGDPFLDDEVLGSLGDFIFLDDYQSQFSVCHFWVDKVPRIHAFEISKFRAFIFQTSEYVVDVMNLFYPDLEIIAPSVKKGTFKFDKVMVGTFSTIHYSHALSSGSSDSYISKFIKHLKLTLSSMPLPTGGIEKIFISRSDASYRNAINYTELEAYFESQGYTVVAMGDYGPIQQINLLKDATHIAGIHGAGLTNIIFSALNNRVKVLEIFAPGYGSPSYFNCANAMGYEYSYYVANSVDGYMEANRSGLGRNVVTDNLVIDIEDLNQFIKKNNLSM